MPILRHWECTDIGAETALDTLKRAPQQQALMEQLQKAPLTDAKECSRG